LGDRCDIGYSVAEVAADFPGAARMTAVAEVARREVGRRECL